MAISERPPEEIVAALDDDELASELAAIAVAWFASPEYYSALMSEGLRRKIAVEREGDE